MVGYDRGLRQDEALTSAGMFRVKRSRAGADCRGPNTAQNPGSLAARTLQGGLYSYMRSRRNTGLPLFFSTYCTP